MSVNNGQNSKNHSRLASIDSPDSQCNKRALIQRYKSFDSMGTAAEAKVLVIYTGGTIGMTRNSNNGNYDYFFCVFGFFFFSFVLRSCS